VEIDAMNLVFSLDGVICHDNKPLANVVEFMRWLKDKEHYITIWTTRENTLENKMDTENWLKMEQVTYDRLIFDRPEDPVFVDETPPNSKYYEHYGDNNIISMLFEEWKQTLC
jgi:hypothetical protein